VFQLTDITKNFGATVALNKISLEIKQGEHVALIGSSGSGKTTLLKLLNGQVMQSSGSYSIAASQLNSLSNKNLRKLRSEIAYIPQDLGLIPQLKVFQNILLGRVGKHSALGMLGKFLIPPQNNLQNIFSLLERVGIPEKMYQHTATLSGGQQQRIRALLLSPPLQTQCPNRPTSAASLLAISTTHLVHPRRHLYLHAKVALVTTITLPHYQHHRTSRCIVFLYELVKPVHVGFFLKT